MTQQQSFRYFPLLALLTVLTGCGSPDSAYSHTVKVNQICGEKPNCVSTLDNREEHALAPFELSKTGLEQWAHIEKLALSLPGASLAKRTDDYLHVECTSKVFRFVDDFEVQRQSGQLTVRSESRTGYSDFGVNRKRAEAFRKLLAQEGYLKN
ncbi:DUF1499 domain-containing protein [Photobacterium sp. DA100]|uniref:DUF1499 domain-containing protein n=1 Tax=Photobacterium sp. DA100 TaxID=3027472 RepID=UPI002479D087|nr:DUF1499 domain-containing protein [Photobacterium sp. DA100]WEM41674.1 DUF1499 domain-containing protein [Photobacterium sp. DA100]